jgi:hypothetical protein
MLEKKPVVRGVVTRVGDGGEFRLGRGWEGRGGRRGGRRREDSYDCRASRPA